MNESDTLRLARTRGTPAIWTLTALSGSVVLVECDPGLSVRVVVDDDWRALVIGEPVAAPLAFEGVMSAVSEEVGSHRAVLEHRGEDGSAVAELVLVLSIVQVRVDVDADRDGVVGENEPGKQNWVWGADQRGAIALVNNDRDPADVADAELAEVWIRPAGAALPDDCELVLITTDDEAERLTLYRDTPGGEVLLGVDPAHPEQVPRTVSPPLGGGGVRGLLEARDYPGAFFEGLLTLELQLRQGGQAIGTDRAVLRVAPWIMTPNTVPAVEVFTCDMRGTDAPNDAFLAQLTETCQKIGVPLRLVTPDENGGDRWIQDEVEFGFSQSPRHVLPVMCDSPRDRELRDWVAAQLGADLGRFQVGGSTPNSLDSFGNLEVSPPVTVRGTHYPFGRIVFGGRAHGDYGPATRQMMPELRRFLHAQKVQAPIEIYTDWLTVGHADEIVSFVPPPPGGSGFRILLASPRKARGILDRLGAGGSGDAVLFAGMRRRDPTGPSAETTVAELLADAAFWTANDAVQTLMDLNREILKAELEIDEASIIEVPVLFWPPEPGGDGRTAAFFPDMVNHLVLGEVSLVPDPHGPVVDGRDAFAAALVDALPDRSVVFLEDWYAYHKLLGEVHCGTNVRRAPDGLARWWEHRPHGGWDI